MRGAQNLVQRNHYHQDVSGRATDTLESDVSEADNRRYVDIVGRMINGGEVSDEEFQFHIGLQNRDIQSGTPIGLRLPDFALPDETGATRTVADLAGPNGLLLVFVRSVTRCPYCRNQLAEMNLSLGDARARGVNVAAVTTDAMDVVQDFVAFAQVQYRVLVDQNADVIERLGLLNVNLPKDSPANNGGRIPFAGHYLLAPDGTVLDKAFTDDLRHRASGADLIFKHYGPGSSSVGVEINAGELKAEVILATGRVLNNQDIAFRVRFEVQPGWHVYGSPLSADYTPLALEFDDILLSRQRLDLPPPELLTFEASGETFPVHEGAFEATGTIRLKWSPPSGLHRGREEQFAKQTIQPGDYKLRGHLRYQACSEKICLTPETVPFELPLRIEPDAPPVRSSFPVDHMTPGLP